MTNLIFKPYHPKNEKNLLLTHDPIPKFYIEFNSFIFEFQENIRNRNRKPV